jgi:plastocyanin
MTLRLASLGQGRPLLLILVLTITGCSKSPDPPPATQAAPPPAAKPAAPGTVSGTAPSTGLVVVVLDPATPKEYPPQTDMPVMDQVGQTFGPAVLLVRTGQPVEFRNSDDTLHNVHVSNEDTRADAFNVAIPTGTSYTFKFPGDGFYHVGCDIHPAMAAEIVATTTPYATIAGPDGHFEFADVAPGAYKLTVYAGGRKMQRDVEMKGESVTVDARSGT